MYDKKIKAAVEIFYKSNNTTAKEVSKKFNIPYTTIKTWIDNEKWESGSAIKDIETTQQEVVTNNFTLVTNTAQNNIKKEITQNLGSISYEVDRVVLESLLNESSESLLLQAMGLNHINKSLALNAAIAKNALLELSLNNDHSTQNNMAIIACSEKVSKIFNDLKVSLYGKDATTSNQEITNYEELSDTELQALLAKCDNEE